MNYQEYCRLTEEVTNLMANNKYAEAYDALHRLLLSDISDIDKAAMCVKLSRIEDRRGNTMEALQWLDKGIAYEEPYYRYSITEEKVRYLTQIGQSREGVPIYEGLIAHPSVSEEEKERMRKMVKSLLSRSIGEWK